MTASRPVLRRAVALAAASTALTAAMLTGCSSSGHVSSPAGSAGSSAGAAPVSNTGSTQAASSSSGSGGGGGGLLGGNGFCAAAKAAEAGLGSAATSLTSDSPAQLQKFEQKALGELTSFVAIAPASIKGDVTVIAAATKKLYAGLAAAHYNFTKIDPSLVAQVETPTFNKAVDRVSAYLSKTCGIKEPTG